MYGLWVQMICGQINQATLFPTPASRQWAEVLRSVKCMLDGQSDGRLNTFSYGQIRYDLHPETRRQLLSKLLEDISTIAAEALGTAMRNLSQDAGEALDNTSSQEEQTQLAHQLSLSQRAVLEKLGKNEIVYWWGNMIHHVSKMSEELKHVLIKELRSLLEDPVSTIQLSAVFGLACLRVEGIDGIVDRAMSANPEWSSNRELAKWLERLRKGSISYPSGLIVG